MRQNSNIKSEYYFFCVCKVLALPILSYSNLTILILLAFLRKISEVMGYSFAVQVSFNSHKKVKHQPDDSEKFQLN